MVSIPSCIHSLDHQLLDCEIVLVNQSSSLKDMFRTAARTTLFNTLGARSSSMGPQMIRPFSSTLKLGKVTEITNMEGFQQLIQSDKLSVVDFYATWCGPCKMIEPFVEKLSEQTPQVSFGRVDVDEVTEVASANEITAMPTIMFFKGGNAVDKVIGANLNAIMANVEKYADKE